MTYQDNKMESYCNVTETHSGTEIVINVIGSNTTYVLCEYNKGILVLDIHNVTELDCPKKQTLKRNLCKNTNFG